MEGTLGILFGIGIPALIVFSWIFFNSKERLLMIKENLTSEQIIDIYKQKKNPYLSLQVGLVIIFVGIGMSLGFLVDQYSFNQFLAPFCFITFIGFGLIVAHFAARKYEKEDRLGNSVN
ncbi:MAG: hypothetical protein JEY94_03575 [Melioribacteraceae bacterium]|nr:hypothetical protein [Melioribacteraceae bacterium]